MKKLVSSFFTLILFAQFTLASAHYSDLHNCLKKDSFTLSSAYFDGYYTNKQLVNFNMDCLRASDRALEWLENQEWFDKLNLSQKWLIRFSSWFFLFFVNQQAYIALHDEV
ncbi:MAG: hypothetical protein LBB37_04080 [Endomicrobium sp.]|jgi:hypothetical protein|nr:hypothetical protein [Endomicrobium sp.]